ncbi:MAG: HAMP domain-containing histidine kinase [Chloroflexi bacterium]|nr:HAMP domain-containing histidine kinase [Chloroflexota bacterium]
MGSFKFAWICSLVSLCLLSAAVIVLQSEPAGLVGLGQVASLLLAVWLFGLGSTALIVAYERATRQRLLRIERRNAEREASLRTAEAAAHELAQPLTVVMAYAQWLQRGSTNQKDHRYYLEQMVASCHEMSVILRHLYETIRHSRAQAGLTILDEPLPLHTASSAEGDEDGFATPPHPSAPGAPTPRRARTVLSAES